MEKQQRWTVIEVLNWSHQDLASHGCEKPRLDAELLLGHALELSRLELYTNFDRPMTPMERERFRGLLKRRRNREPVAYILGRKEFYSLDFSVSPAVLVPRPETELLVEKLVAAKIRGAVADVGTGSGCVAIAAKKAMPEIEMFACDLSAEAIAVARENASRLGVEVHFHQGDLLAAFPEEQRFAAIVSNPPYIDSTDLTTLEPEIAFEPRQALDGGPDGLTVIRRLVSQASAALQTGGLLLIEIGADQGPATEAILSAAGFAEVSTLRDLASRDRVVRGRWEQ